MMGLFNFCYFATLRCTNSLSPGYSLSVCDAVRPRLTVNSIHKLTNGARVMDMGGLLCYFILPFNLFILNAYHGYLFSVNESAVLKVCVCSFNI